MDICFDDAVAVGNRNNDYLVTKPTVIFDIYLEKGEKEGEHSFNSLERSVICVSWIGRFMKSALGLWDKDPFQGLCEFEIFNVFM